MSRDNGSPRDDEDFEDFDRSEEVEESLDYGGDVPPWSPVPIAVARKFLEKFPEAQIELVFPTVYEEDRSIKIKDLATLQSLGTITHQRMSEQGAKEIGFEQYDYQEEMEQIRAEKQTMPQLGAGDALLGGVLGAGAKPGAEPAKPVAARIADEEPLQKPKRADLAADEQAKFRKEQKDQMAEVQRLLESARQDQTTLREVAAHLAETARRLDEIAKTPPPAPHVEVHPADVHVDAPHIEVHPPNVEIHTPDVKVEGPKIDVQPAAAPDVHVASPPVEVNVTVQPPASQKRVIVERDPRTGQMSGATIENEEPES